MFNMWVRAWTVSEDEKAVTLRLVLPNQQIISVSVKPGESVQQFVKFLHPRR